MKPVIFTADGGLNTKSRRVQDFRKQLAKHPAPESYSVNNTKEELCMEYVKSFINQFMSFYPTRKVPFMIAENECGVQKFVCSTLRPTELVFSELYDMHECAVFIAGYMQYEPLDPVDQPPKIMPSPGQSLDWHTGDSFDMAMILCSLLIGNGYDAYVVNGYAPKYITLKDQSKTPCPLTSKLTEPSLYKPESESSNDQVNSSNDIQPYQIPDNFIKESKFIESQKEKKRLEALDTFILWNEEEMIRGIKSNNNSLNQSNNVRQSITAGSQAFTNEFSTDKEKLNSRCHAWVLVKAGRRDIHDHVFLEPSTGRAYSIQSSPYEGIECVWNKTNYWVNTSLLTKPTEVNYMKYVYVKRLLYLYICYSLTYVFSFYLSIYIYIVGLQFRYNALGKFIFDESKKIVKLRHKNNKYAK